MTEVKFAWHIHHSRDLMEVLTEPIKVRRDFIHENKPKHELKQRLRLLKPVRGKLPAKLVKVGAALKKATNDYSTSLAAHKRNTTEYWAVFDHTYYSLQSARGAYTKVIRACGEKIAALHEKECPDCPWDGWTIFP